MAVEPAAAEAVTTNDAALDASSLSDTEYLAKLGYKQELKRDLGLFSAFGVQFSSIAVTSSMCRRCGGKCLLSGVAIRRHDVLRNERGVR